MRPSIVLSMAVLASVAPSLAIPVSRSPSSPEWKREDASDSSSDDLESGAVSTKIGKAATYAGIGTSLIFGTAMMNDLLKTPPPQVVYLDQDGQPIQYQKRDSEEPPSHDEDTQDGQDGESDAIGLVDAASLAGMATSAYFLTPMLKEFIHPQQQQYYKREYAELVARAPAAPQPAPAAHHEEVVPEGGVNQKQELSKLDKMGLFSSLGLGGVAVLSMLKQAMADDGSA